MDDFVRFAERACLMQPVIPAATTRLVRRAAAARHLPGTWLLHTYLPLRLRLLDPDRFLTTALPFVRWIFSRAYLAALAVVIACALFLVSQQWELFRHSLVDLFTLGGMLTVRLALCVGKAVHEHGHGLAARLPGAGDGSRLVLAPVLWIGIAGAWKLVRRRDRLLIDASGMLAEISLASPAALLWCVLGDGPLRNACFTLSRSTWLLTLAVNLSPLIRFDGYYILSDSLGFPNLLDRGPCRRDRPAPHPARRRCPLLSGRRQPGDPGNGEPRCRGVGPYQRRAGVFLDQPGTGCRTRGPVPEGAIYPARLLLVAGGGRRAGAAPGSRCRGHQR